MIPGLGRCPGEGNGNPLQNSCLENSMDREAWQAKAHEVTKSWTRLSDRHIHTYKLSAFGFCLHDYIASYSQRGAHFIHLWNLVDIQKTENPKCGQLFSFLIFLFFLFLFIFFNATFLSQFSLLFFSLKSNTSKREIIKL